MSLRTLVTRTGPALAATALLGSLGTKPKSEWYQDLEKPPWQPPAWLFGPVWTSIYAATAVSAARTRDRLGEGERRQFDVLLGTNLARNVGFSWLFFASKRPGLALVDQLALQATTLELLRRSARTDRAAGALLVPYAAWNTFAIVLNAEVVRRNGLVPSLPGPSA